MKPEQGPIGAEAEGGERARLADVIKKRLGDIDQRWLERVRATVGCKDVSPSELRDSMPEYLERLADALRREGTVEEGGSASWVNVAREHAETRVHLGFDIDQLVREFIILRHVLSEVLEEEGVLIDFRHAGKIADLIDAAIEAAVKSYVTSRDYQVRKQEAEHVGFITHELRNPLTTAMLGTHHLRGAAPPEQREHTLDIVERNLRRLSELIEGVLLLERGTHALKPQPTVVTLGQLLEQPLSAARLAAETKQLSFEARFDPDLALHVDPKLSASAIDNILQNAIKYTDRGEVRVNAEDSPSQVVLHVRDTGPGIPKEELPRIFEPFRRSSPAEKPGAGLGLAIARRAIEVQGGTIHAESDGGSHFWLTLPKPRH